MKKIVIFAMALVAASTLFARGPVHHRPMPPPIHSSHHHHHHHHGSGGAIRDWDVIDCANDAGVAMVFTGQRSFRH